MIERGCLRSSYLRSESGRSGPTSPLISIPCVVALVEAWLANGIPQSGIRADELPGLKMLFRLVVHRSLSLVLVLFGLTVMTFVLARLIPADPARLMAGPHADQGAVDALQVQYGLDEPLVQQYVHYLQNLLRFDLGTSFGTHRPVRDDLGYYLPATIELGLYSMILATTGGVLLGIIASMYRSSWIDNVVRMVSMTGLAIPIFWLAILAQYLFFERLGWLPDGQRLPLDVVPPPTVTRLYTVDALIAGDWEVFWLAVRHLMLPVAVLSFASLAIVTRMVRGVMLDVLGQDYIRTARAKGLSSRGVFFGHGLRNALLPIVTLVGLQAGVLLSGAFMIEIIFSWPGIGRYSVEAIQRVDYNAILGTTLTVAVIIVVINLVVDVLNACFDPRITHR